MKEALVYPRACGGTPPPCASGQHSRGLSPRLRGNRPGCRRMLPRRGSIPAPAGEPSMESPPPDESAVYPRACGGTH